MDTAVVLFGNKCGHDPNNPRFYSPIKSNKALPDVLEIAKRNLKDFYYQTERLLQLKLLRHSFSVRQYRSESREAICAVLGAILQHTDLKTLEVGRYNSATGQVTPIKIETLATYAGVGNKRCARVVELLYRCGYLQLQRRSLFDKKTNSYIGLSAIKKVTIFLFYHLGISKLKLSQAITYALNQAKKLKREKEKEKELEQTQLYPTLIKPKKPKQNKHKTDKLFKRNFRSSEGTLLSEDIRKQIITLLQDLEKAEPNLSLHERACKARTALGLRPESPHGLNFV